MKNPLFHSLPALHDEKASKVLEYLGSDRRFVSLICIEIGTYRFCMVCQCSLSDAGYIISNE